MNNNIRIIYLYVISFITLAMIVTGITSTVNNIASYFYPDDYVFFREYDYDDDYNDNYSYEIEKENYKTEKIKDSVVSLVVVVMGAVLYKYHWNLVKKEGLSNNSN